MSTRSYLLTWVSGFTSTFGYSRANGGHYETCFWLALAVSFTILTGVRAGEFIAKHG
jgi:hypothetical protein